LGTFFPQRGLKTTVFINISQQLLVSNIEF